MNEFIKKLMAHTIASQQRWHRNMEDKRVSHAVWNQVLTEEVGKLNRCCNKLAIVLDKDVEDQWQKEAKYRLITIASICMRFYAAFDDCEKDIRDGHLLENVVKGVSSKEKVGG
jgi:hypothetical protein